MSSTFDRKRKQDNDDKLFSYGNTMELAFGKKKKFIINERFDASDDDDSDVQDDSILVDSSGFDITDDQETSVLSSEDEGDNSNDKIFNNIASPMLSPSPPPPPKLNSRMLTNGNIKNSVRQLQNILKSVKDDQPFTSPMTQQMSSRISDLVVLDESPMSRDIMVKISCHGIVNKYKINENEQFLNIKNKIAMKENVSKDKILLSLDQRSIEDSDTLASIGYTVADIIQCLVLVEEPLNDNNGNSNTINVKLQTKDSHSKKQYSIKLTDALETVVKPYCEEKGIKLQGLRVFFDGELVNLQQTPQELDMDDDNILDLLPN